MAKQVQAADIFGEWVSANRVKQGLTLEGLAELAATSKSSVWATEQGQTFPRLDSADKIARALGVPLWKALQQAESSHAKRSSAGTKSKRA